MISASKLRTQIRQARGDRSQASLELMTSRIRLARKTPLLQFAQLAFPGYELRPYLEGVSRAFEKMCEYYETRGESGEQNVIVSMPRRYGKSEISRIFALYFLARNPDGRVILVSYGSTLAYKHSRAARDYAMSDNVVRFFPQITMSEDTKSRSEWDLAYFRGGMDAAGIGGGLTGKGYDLLLADDLIKSWTDANSDTVTNQIWDDFQSTVLNGANESYSVKLCIGTRWTNSDPLGRLTSGGDGTAEDITNTRWLNLSLPAIAYQDERIVSQDHDVLWERKEFQALHPPRHTLEQLLEIQEVTPHYLWEAQWQQRPVEEVGKIIRLSWIDAAISMLVPPNFVRMARGWDIAWSTSDLSDWSVGVKMGIDKDGLIWILDMVRFRLDFSDLVERIAKVAKMDGQFCRQYIEKNARGSEAVRLLNMDSRLHLHRLTGISVSTDKLTRAQPFIGRLAEGVLKIKHTHWTDTMKNEMLIFTGNKDRHDDIVDAISLCYNGLAGNAPMTVNTSRISL